MPLRRENTDLTMLTNVQSITVLDTWKEILLEVKTPSTLSERFCNLLRSMRCDDAIGVLMPVETDFVSFIAGRLYSLRG